MIQGLYKIFDRWHAQGTLWIYSDPHFGDKDLAQGITGRPTDEEQIKMINSKVGKKDTIIFLGDIGDVECARRVRGRKILIMGNHDAGRSNYEEVFEEIYEGPLMISEKLILSHEPIDVPWAFNIHGHEHHYVSHPLHMNVCADVIGYTPVNMNQFMKSGMMSKVKSIHRSTIDSATKKSKKAKKVFKGGRVKLC